MLIELSPPAPDADRVAELCAQLRLPAGAVADPDVAAMLRRLSDAALARVERLTARALARRRFALRVASLAEPAAIPVEPAVAVEAVETVDPSGARIAHAPADWRIETATAGARLRHVGTGAAPATPPGGHGEAVIVAGYGPRWADVPAELREAVALLAARAFDDGAAGADAAAALPRAVAALVEPYRRVRL
jgi:uncharacterized phiE125 gp8 family phage protein